MASTISRIKSRASDGVRSRTLFLGRDRGVVKRGGVVLVVVDGRGGRRVECVVIGGVVVVVVVVS